MSEHQDKGRSGWTASTDTGTGVPPAIIGAEKRDAKTEAQLREAEKKKKLAEEAEKLRKRKEEKLIEQRAELNTQWEAFLADTSQIEALALHGIDWATRGFMLQVFIADFAPKSGLLIEDDVLKKVSPYAKIVARSPYNGTTDSLEDKRKAEWQIGDIVHIGDIYMNYQMNPNWAMWQEANKTNQRFLTPEPPQHIRKIYGWILDGRLYVADKAKYMLNSDFCLMDEKTLSTFPGPYVFEAIDYNYDALTKRITGNPWA